MIVSSIEGRIRIRDRQLKEPAVGRALSEALAAAPGIERVAHNPRVGSLLVLFDRAVTDLKRLRELLRGLLDLEDAPTAPPETSRELSCTLPGPRIQRRQILNIGMLGSLTASLAALAVDSMLLHVAAGILFVGLAALHAWDKRHTLFV